MFILSNPDTPEVMLTLTICHPKYSAAEK